MDIKRIEVAARASYDSPPIDFSRILSFPNRLASETTCTSLPCFPVDDNDHSARFHVMIFLSHMSQNNIQHEDHMMAMLAHSLQGDASCWLHECFPEKSITSLAKCFEIFLK